MDQGSAQVMTASDYDILELVTGFPSISINVNVNEIPPRYSVNPPVNTPKVWNPPPPY